MKKIILIIIPIALLVLGFVAIEPTTPLHNLITQTTNDSTGVLKPKPEHYKEAALIAAILNQHHYSKVKIDDSLSSAIFEEYVNSYDSYHIYFTQEDLNSFEKYRYQLDDLLLNGDVNFAFDVFKVFRERFNERMRAIPGILKTGFDFTKDEYIEADLPKTWYATQPEIDDAWRKLLKSQALNMKLAGKETEDINKTIQDRYDRYEKLISQYNSEDVFQLYMNSFAGTFDPHTSYFSPISAENFEIDMSLSLEGIGARLYSKDDYITFSEIIPGGPAFKSKKLFEGDRIVGVAQEGDTSFVNIIGWRTDDAVQLIRGPKDSKVSLQILDAEATIGAIPKEITIVRDKIKLEEQAATKEIVPVTYKNNQYNIGVINIPSFYRNFEAQRQGDENFESTQRDVKRILNELKAENVDGVLIDLRRNGGGSLQEAIELTGLFIPDGPVVQVKNADGSIDVGTDPDPETVYDGPLAVMVDRFSASASEIFTGAIQDYKRGVIIGEQTFGKGTVQNLIALDRFIQNSDEKLGQLKLTLAKYYRINGSSTQHLGVSPDIAFPSPFSAEEYGESAQANALPWDQIRSTVYQTMNQVDEKLIDRLNISYSQRLKTNKELQELIEGIEYIKENKGKDQISLNEEVRKEELEEEEAKREKMKISDSDEEGEGESEKKDDDIYLKEGTLILAEMIANVG
ncbi:carboxy terminal-processing peptidase [Chondrinema litorale]|uniref:carboxy terminal-processing peptidase n=1 Tax=Chondrinema litorale TaxID=2994555 RepID=UPI002542FF27|nr:carboxy terminal-processing peptidase [Chondrinema litorale]UZR94602.1 carboxy terminal-processing peptidase [Chondrinema litorale]